MIFSFNGGPLSELELRVPYISRCLLVDVTPKKPFELLKNCLFELLPQCSVLSRVSLMSGPAFLPISRFPSDKR